MGDKYSGIATASFVLSISGVVGFNILFLLPSILGIIFGFTALKKIKKNPKLEGKGLAIAGIIIGFVALIMTLILATIIAFLWAKNAGDFT